MCPSTPRPSHQDMVGPSATGHTGGATANDSTRHPHLSGQLSCGQSPDRVSGSWGALQMVGSLNKSAQPFPWPGGSELFFFVYFFPQISDVG